ncbi:PIH1 domain-containing protein 1-like [Watersipora subatra]|uniref:PIH1 domain-containing protein 1-like n=1 Tax=Watersipora subatra TaxID=2589382 RepID=UPI00355B079B
MENFQESLLLETQDGQDDKALLQDFMKMYGDADVSKEPKEDTNFAIVVPKPRFCVKTRSDGGEKIFLNICTAEHIPAPKDISDNELLKLLNSDDPSQFRVPMSLGEPHAEVDKSGKGCTAYDIAINPSFSDKIDKNNLFMGFFMSVIMEGLDNKYSVKLSREWVKLKNKRSMGFLQSQHIRSKSKPFIMEMDSDNAAQKTSASSSSHRINSESVSSAKSVEPKYRIIREPITGHPEFLSVEVELPEIRSGKALTLDIGEDCIILDSRSKVYHLSLYLPYNLIQQDCGAQFDKQSRKLTLTLPVMPLSVGD